MRVPIDRAIDMLAQKGLPSHNYLDDILAGRKPPVPPSRPQQQNRKEVAMRSKRIWIAALILAAAFSATAAAQQYGSGPA